MNQNEIPTVCHLLHTVTFIELKVKHLLLQYAVALFMGLLLPFIGSCHTAESKTYFIDKSVVELETLVTQQSLSNPTIFHLFTHGKAGELWIENEWKNQAELATWFSKQTFQDIEHLNIYGCHFGEGEKGRTAIEYLEAALGISVAASDDLTGVDGDWDLEVGTSKQSIALPDYAYNLQTCSCVEYLYLNEVSGSNGIIHKYAINSNGTINEIGNPWLTTPELPSPHGLGADINGFLYIGERATSGDVRKITCDGTVLPETEWVYPSGGQYNIGSIGSLLYFNNRFSGAADNQDISAVNTCTMDLEGTLSFCEADVGYDWGFYVDPRTDKMYATHSRNVAGVGYVWEFDASDFDNDPATCVSSVAAINTSLSASVRINGITTDEDENIYIVMNDGPDYFIRKYGPAPAYTLLATSPIDSDGGDGTGWSGAIGIVYSETAQRLYVSSIDATEDCVTSFPKDLSSATTVIGSVPSLAASKGMVILKECCPNFTPINIDRIVCNTNSNEEIFLQDLTGCEGDGVICEGQWDELSNTSGGDITFDPCQSSVTIEGTGCATYSLAKETGAVGTQQCDAFAININIEVVELFIENPSFSCMNGEGQVSFDVRYFKPCLDGTLTIRVDGQEIPFSPFNISASSSAQTMNVIANVPTDGGLSTVEVSLNEGVCGTSSDIQRPSLPSANSASMTLCEDSFNSRMTEFNLSLLTDDVNSNFTEGIASTGGVFTSNGNILELTYHLTMSDADADMNALPNPENFTNTNLSTQTLFARVEDLATGCHTVGIVSINASGLPDADNLEQSICEDPTTAGSRSGIDLTMLEILIAGGNPAGSFTIQWFSDMALTMPVAMPMNATVNNGDVFYAHIVFIDSPMCENIANVTYEVAPAPSQMDITVDICEDNVGSGQTILNLTDYDLAIAGGTAALISWYEDPALSMPVANANAVQVQLVNNGAAANLFHALISDGTCDNMANLAVTLLEQPNVEAGGVYEFCSGDAVTLSGASIGVSASIARWTVVGGPVNGDGVIMPSGLIANPATSTFTASIAGVYTIRLETDDPAGPCGPNIDQATVIVHSLPMANPEIAEVCIGETVNVDGMPSGGTPAYTHQWTDLGTGTAIGHTLTNTDMQMVTVDASGVAVNAGAGTVELQYQVTDSEGCMTTATTTITIHPLPMPNVTPINNAYCPGENVPAVGVAGVPLGVSVMWFQDAAATIPVSGAVISGSMGELLFLSSISSPAAPNTGMSVSVYARYMDNSTGCMSNTTTESTLTQNTIPLVSNAAQTLCEDNFNSRMTEFDLSLLTDDINNDFTEGMASVGGVFTSSNNMLELTYHLNMSDADNQVNAIPNPENFTNTNLSTQTLFARVEDRITGCYTVSIVDINASGLPDADNIEQFVCEDPATPGSRSGIDLTGLEMLVAGGNPVGSFTLQWFNDMALTMPVAMPMNATVNNGDVFYAHIVFIDSPMCENIANVTYEVAPAPSQMDITVDVCEDNAGSGEVNLNLTDFDLAVAGGTAALVSWYEDPAFSIPVANANAVEVQLADNGTAANLFHALISDGNCENMANITLTILEQPTVEAGGVYEVCSESIITLDGASIGASASMAMWRIIDGPISGDGVIMPSGLIANPSTAIFTASIAGVYTIRLETDDPAGPCGPNTDEATVIVHPLPMANPEIAEVCIGETVNIDGMPSGGTPSYTHQWTDLGTGTATGYTLANTDMQMVTVDASGVAVNAGAGTVELQYQVTDSEGCMTIATTTITIHPLPMPNVTPINNEYCPEENIPAVGVAGVSLGMSVMWFQDAAATIPVSGAVISGSMGELLFLSSISSPAAPNTGMSVSVYARYMDNSTGCMSNTTTESTLTQNTIPLVSNAAQTLCEDNFNSATTTFDLSLLTDDINNYFIEGMASVGGVFTSSSNMLELTYHLNMSDAENGINALPNPESFTNTTLSAQTLFVRVEDSATGCYNTAQILLSIAGLPDVDNLNLTICPDLNSTVRTGIDISAVGTTIAGGNTSGSYNITWFTDARLSMPLNNPMDVTVADGDIYYALVIFNDAPMCQNVGELSYMVQMPPPIMDLSLDFCEDEVLMGQVANINLRDNDLTVGAGMAAIVNWFQDSNFSIPVPDPTNVTVQISNNSTPANTFYASINDGDCTNRARLMLTVFEQPVPLPAGPYEVCAEEIITLNGASIAGSAMVAAWYITDMPIGGDGVIMPMGFLPSPGTVTFTASVAGDYTLTLITDDPSGPCPENMATTIVTVHPLPEPMPPLTEVCVGSTVTVDGTPTEGTAPYITHQWIDLGLGTASGYSLSNSSIQVVTVDASMMNNTQAGTVVLEYTVTDTNGCMQSTTTTITIHPLPIPNPMNAMVCVGKSLTIDANPTEGTAPFMHQWVDFGTGTASNYTLDNVDTQVVRIDASNATDTDAGTVDLEYTVTDSNGCMQSATITVSINALPMIMPMDGNITCEAPREVTIAVTTSAMNPSYMWIGPGIVMGSTTATPTVNQPGTYTVTVTDGTTGCMNMVDIFVTQDPLSKCLPATFEIKVKGGE